MSESLLGSAKSTDILYEEDTGGFVPDAATTTESKKRLAESTISKNVTLIEDFLTHYLRYSTPNCEANRKTHLPLNSETLGYTAIVLDFEIEETEPSYEDLLPILSDVLSLKVRYKVVGSNLEEEKIDFFIVKIPATNPEDRQLAALANVDHREILFYTHTVPDIRECLERGNIQLDLSFAQCYHARYDRALEQQPVAGVIEDLTKAESIIILEDLRPGGFGKRHYVQPLTLLEIKTALREIAKVHAATWCIQEISGQHLSKSWPFHYKPEYASMLYEALLEDGLPRLEKFLKEQIKVNRDERAARILEGLDNFKHRGIRTILFKLLSPAQDSTPNCLVHMDFWCDNLFFRRIDSSLEADGLNYFDKLANDVKLDNLRRDDTENLECRILDWQMFSVGKPTHDIALLLFTSLDSEVRKNCTDGLLEFYFRIFRQTAAYFNVALTFDLGNLSEQYKRSKLLAVLQVIASVDLVLTNESTQERLFDALIELMDEKLL